MWARIKGKAENALIKMPFKHVVNLRPALMKPTAGQVHVGTALRLLASVLAWVPGLEAITLK